MVQYIILIPTRQEYDNFLDECPEMKLEKMQIGKIQGCIYKEYNVFIACGGKGRLQFGLTSQYLLDHSEHIKALFCVGSAGALDKDLNIGDIVIAEMTVQFDMKGVFIKRNPVYKGSEDILTRIKELGVLSAKNGVLLGLAACGDEDIISRERAMQIVSETGACITAWEGAGGAAACRFHKIPFLEVRAVTDFCRGNIIESYTDNLSQAMRKLSNLLFSENFLK